MSWRSTKWESDGPNGEVSKKRFGCLIIAAIPFAVVLGLCLYLLVSCTAAATGSLQ